MEVIKTYKEMVLENGEIVNLTLNFAALYKLKGKNEDVYNRYNDVRMHGMKDELDQAIILYAAYLCANIENLKDCIDEMTFYALMPENHVLVSLITGQLLNGKKK
jgi:hypothetical protein